MKKEMLKVYRRSSPRTGKPYDTRLILRRDLKRHLASNWHEDPPNAILSPDEISDKLKSVIRTESGSIQEIARRHNVSYYSARKIRNGEL